VAAAAAAESELGAEMARVDTLGVYSLGGRGFSFTVLERREADEGAAVGWGIAAARRVDGGGLEAIDSLLVESLVAEFAREETIDLSQDHLALARLHDAAESAKLELCSAGAASISLPFITADASGPKHMELTLSRARFDELARPVLRGTLQSCDEALAEAGVRAASLDAVLLVGGSARLPVVAELAAEHFGAAPLRLARPEEAVAIGAARRAQELLELRYQNAG
jgi:molecular chaperone DnaK